MDRKEFIRTCSFLCLRGSALTALATGCATSNYFAATTLDNNRLIIKKSEFEVAGQAKPTLRKYVLIRAAQYNYPIIVYRFDDGTYSALLMECTHKNCELQPQGAYLVCPCHGSEFSNMGVVQNPPAEENLRTFQIIQDDDHLYIQLRAA